MICGEKRGRATVSVLPALKNLPDATSYGGWAHQEHLREEPLAPFPHVGEGPGVVYGETSSFLRVADEASVLQLGPIVGWIDNDVAEGESLAVEAHTLDVEAENGSIQQSPDAFFCHETSLLAAQGAASVFGDAVVFGGEPVRLDPFVSRSGVVFDEFQLVELFHGGPEVALREPREALHAE